MAESEIGKDARAIGDWFSQKAQSGFRQIDQTYKEIKDGTSKPKAVRTERPAEPRQAREPSGMADLGVLFMPVVLLVLLVLLWARGFAIESWLRSRFFGRRSTPRT